MKQNNDFEGTTAVCVGAPNNAKRAALFFESIWHLCPTFESAPREVFPEKYNHDGRLRDQYHELVNNLAFNHPEMPKKLEQAFSVVPPNKTNNRTDATFLLPKDNELLHRMAEETYISNAQGIRDRFLKLVGPVSPIHPIPVISNAHSLQNQNASVGDITVTLSNLPIVDVTNASWKQIVEFRNDVNSAKAVRRLHVFLYENCKNTSRAYIEDKIQTELEQYHTAINKHGFELVTGSLTTLIDSRNIIAASATIAAAAYIGGPLTAIATEVFLEISKFAIQVARNRHALRELKRDHPLAYIIKAQEALA